MHKQASNNKMRIDSVSSRLKKKRMMMTFQRMKTQDDRTYGRIEFGMLLIIEIDNGRREKQDKMRNNEK